VITTDDIFTGSEPIRIWLSAKPPAFATQVICQCLRQIRFNSYVSMIHITAFYSLSMQFQGKKLRIRSLDDKIAKTDKNAFAEVVAPMFTAW
jgi:hypothetical protein